MSTEEKKGWKEIPMAGVCWVPSTAYLTGDWKTYRPVWDSEKCTRCMLCHLYCPDGAIAWKPETNEGSDVPVPTVNEPNPYIERSTLWLENGSFLRIKNMQLGVSLPDKTLNKLNLDKLRFYIAVQNLYTFTKYSGLEPEVGSDSPVGWVGDPTLNNGIDEGTFPQARTFMIGLQLEL